MVLYFGFGATPSSKSLFRAVFAWEGRMFTIMLIRPDTSLSLQVNANNCAGGSLYITAGSESFHVSQQAGI